MDGLRSLAHRARETMGRAVVQAAAAACITAALEDASDVFPGLLTRIGAPRVYFYVAMYFFTLSFFHALFLLLTSPSLRVFLFCIYSLFIVQAILFVFFYVASRCFQYWENVHALRKGMSMKEAKRYFFIKFILYIDNNTSYIRKQKVS